MHIRLCHFREYQFYNGPGYICSHRTRARCTLDCVILGNISSTMDLATFVRLEYVPDATLGCVILEGYQFYTRPGHKWPNTRSARCLWFTCEKTGPNTVYANNKDHTLLWWWWWPQRCCWAREPVPPPLSAHPAAFQSAAAVAWPSRGQQRQLYFVTDKNIKENLWKKISEKSVNEKIRI